MTPAPGPQVEGLRRTDGGSFSTSHDRENPR
jgi:hypothetical protein